MDEHVLTSIIRDDEPEAFALEPILHRSSIYLGGTNGASGGHLGSVHVRLCHGPVYDVFHFALRTMLSKLDRLKQSLIELWDGLIQGILQGTFLHSLSRSDWNGHVHGLYHDVLGRSVSRN